MPILNDKFHTSLLNIMKESGLSKYLHHNDNLYSFNQKFSFDISEFYFFRDYLLHKINNEPNKNLIFPDPLVTLDLLSKQIDEYNLKLQEIIFKSYDFLLDSIDQMIDKSEKDDDKIHFNIFDNIKTVFKQKTDTLTIYEIDCIIITLLFYLNEIIKTENCIYANELIDKLNELQKSVLLFLISNIVIQFDTLHRTKSYSLGICPDDIDIIAHLDEKEKNCPNFNLKSILTSYSETLIQSISKQSNRSRTPYFKFNKQKFRTEIFASESSPVYFDLAHFKYMTCSKFNTYKTNELLIKEVYPLILGEFDLKQNPSADHSIWELLASSKTLKKGYKDYEFFISLKFIKIIDYLEYKYQFITNLIPIYLKKYYSSFSLEFMIPPTSDPVLKLFETTYDSYSIIGKLFPYHVIEIFSFESDSSLILDYKNYTFEKSTSKICIPVNTFCSDTFKSLKVIDNNPKKSTIKDHILYINIPTFTDNTIEFNITDSKNTTLYKIFVLPTTCRLIEDYKLYLSSNTRDNLFKSISSKFRTKLSSNSDIEDIDIEEEISFRNPSQGIHAMKKYYLNFFEQYKEILLNSDIDSNPLKPAWDCKHIIKPGMKSQINTQFESFKISNFNDTPEDLSSSDTLSEEELLWIFQLTERNFHRYVLDIIA